MTRVALIKDEIQLDFEKRLYLNYFLRLSDNIHKDICRNVPDLTACLIAAVSYNFGLHGPNMKKRLMERENNLHIKNHTSLSMYLC